MLFQATPTSTLARRANHFIQYSSVYEKIAFAFDVVSLIIGIFLVLLVFVALSRSHGHRLPLVAVLIGTVFYLLSHALELAYRLLQYDDSLSSSSSGLLTVLGLNVADAAFTNFTDVIALLAAILVLWNRQASLAFAHPTESPSAPKRVFDIGLVFLLFILVVAQEGLIGAAQTAYYNESISDRTFFSRYISFFRMEHAYAVFVFLAIVNIIVTAVLLKSNISRVDSKRSDKPTNTILFALTPLFLFHWGYFLFQDIWFSAHITNQPAGDTNFIIADVSVVECMVLPACIAIILISLGIRRTIWNTFGDQPVSGGPVFYPPQTQQYYAQQAQPQAVYVSPVYGQQPGAASGQQAVYGQQAWQPERPEQGEMRWKA